MGYRRTWQRAMQRALADLLARNQRRRSGQTGVNVGRPSLPRLGEEGTGTTRSPFYRPPAPPRRKQTDRAIDGSPYGSMSRPQQWSVWRRLLGFR